MDKILNDSRIQESSKSIVDLTVSGASEDELKQAIANSMEIIDAVKKEYA